MGKNRKFFDSIVAAVAKQADEAAAAAARQMDDVAEAAARNADALDMTTAARMNSKGLPIHPTQEGVDNFNKWFQDSAAIDSQGRPIIGYHGSPEVFDTFDPAMAQREDNWSFSSNPNVAATYRPQNISTEKLWKIYNTLDDRRKLAAADEFASFIGDEGINKDVIEAWAEAANGDQPQLWAGDLARELGIEPSELYEPSGGQLVEAYLQLKNPIKRWFEGSEVVKEIRPEGDPDGYIDYNVMDTNSPREYQATSTVYHVNSPSQIKSAVGNSGAFDPTNPSILGAATVGGMATAGALGGAALAAQNQWGDSPREQAVYADFARRRAAKSGRWRELAEAAMTIGSAIPAGIASDVYRMGGYLLPNYSVQRTEQGAQEVANAMTYIPKSNNRYLNSFAREAVQFGKDLEPLNRAWQQTPIYKGYKALPERAQGIARIATDYAF
jgi:hypothetical protein